MAQASETLPVEQLYDALANERRRSCLRYLGDVEGPVPVSDLATAVAGDVADGEDVAERSTYISLIQSHLPKLDAYDVVNYDEDAKTVEPGAAFDETAHCLLTHGTGTPEAEGPDTMAAVSAVTTAGILGAFALTDVRALVLVGLVTVNAFALVLAVR